MFPDSSISLVKVNLKVESVLMLYFHLYNYAIQNNLVSESYDATWSCPLVIVVDLVVVVVLVVVLHLVVILLIVIRRKMPLMSS